jgi:hypothetical protein
MTTGHDDDRAHLWHLSDFDDIEAPAGHACSRSEQALIATCGIEISGALAEIVQSLSESEMANGRSVLLLASE